MTKCRYHVYMNYAYFIMITIFIIFLIESLFDYIGYFYNTVIQTYSLIKNYFN